MFIWGRQSILRNIFTQFMHITTYQSTLLQKCTAVYCRDLITKIYFIKCSIKYVTYINFSIFYVYAAFNF